MAFLKHICCCFIQNGSPLLSLFLSDPMVLLLQCSRVLFEKLIIAELFKEILAFYGKTEDYYHVHRTPITSAFSQITLSMSRVRDLAAPMHLAPKLIL